MTLDNLWSTALCVCGSLRRFVTFSDTFQWSLTLPLSDWYIWIYKNVYWYLDPCCQSCWLSRMQALAHLLFQHHPTKRRKAVVTWLVNGVRDQIFPQLSFIMLFAKVNCLVHVTKFVGYQLQSLLGVAHTTLIHDKHQQYYKHPSINF